MDKNKISIIGVGNVGAEIAYTAAQNKLAKEIVLIDKRKDKPIAESLDISHSLSNGNETAIRSGDYSDIGNSYITVITAGVGRSPGQTRNDLLMKNASIMKDIVSNMKSHYNDGIVIVVSNPVDVMTNLAYNMLNAKCKKVFGTGTLLDTARLKYEISKILKINKSDIECCVIGEHSNNSIVLWDLIKVCGQELTEYLKSQRLELNYNEVLNNMHLSADKIIKGKRFTSYGIASVTCDLIKNVVEDSNKILPVSVNLNGEYDLKDVFLSLPSIISETGIKNVLPPCLSCKEVELLKQSSTKIDSLL